MAEDQRGPEEDTAAPAPPLDDPIVAEVRAIREAQFAAAGYDLAEYARRLKELEAASGHPVITGQPQPRPAHGSAA
ncbi:MAG: hypothetical protein JO180_08275 [Gemmatirosa sp.]|nr:hypothetical protein [Gemmatirosa sp.]